MKRIFILLAYITYLTTLYAQEDFDYRPFIEEGKVWVSKPEIDFVMIGIRTPRPVVEYDYFQGDTLIGTQPCKRWVQDYRDVEGNQIISLVVPMYEENKKVWFFFDGFEMPFLAYDFGAQAGDTVAVVSPCAYHYMIEKRYNYLDEYFKNFSDTLVIKKKAEEELLGKKRTLTYFCSTLRHNGSINSEEFIDYNFLMNGIGTHWNPSYNITWVGSGNGSHWLMYCMVGDEILYADEEKAQYWGIPDPTSIKSFLKLPMVNTPSTQSLFDLSGRRLSVPSTSSADSVLPKGVYIENGKKRVRN